VVRAAIEIPNPNGDAYGDPYWVKIYKTEIERPAVLDDLLMENAEVANAPTEIEWELLQAKPGQGLVINEAPLPPGAEAVIRRYEFYRYNTAWGLVNTYIHPRTGLPVTYVDPANGEVMECVVNGCNDPTPDELGDYIGRQVAGFNIAPDDGDSDSVPGGADNCLGTPNTRQLDTDFDGYGNACDADYDDNGMVGASDWMRLARAFGAAIGSPAYDPSLDADGDGAIGTPEWLLGSGSFGASPGPSGLACAGSVPCTAP
jgi:hypothetical protein